MLEKGKEKISWKNTSFTSFCLYEWHLEKMSLEHVEVCNSAAIKFPQSLPACQDPCISLSTYKILCWWTVLPQNEQGILVGGCCEEEVSLEILVKDRGGGWQTKSCTSRLWCRSHCRYFCTFRMGHFEDLDLQLLWAVLEEDGFKVPFTHSLARWM